ncbi:MAG: C4-dicarboxylate ABC transporter substrate-binding protein, partial [Burkholderiales bacterium]
AMYEAHAEPGLLNAAHDFPTPKDVDIPLSTDAEHYYKSGPSFLQRYLPFWLANLIDRTGLVLVPLAAILVPALRAVPQLYAWRIRRRLYRWYGELKFLETQVNSETPQEAREAVLKQVDHIDETVTHAALPLAFAEHAYALNQHIDFVRRKIASRAPGGK